MKLLKVPLDSINKSFEGITFQIHQYNLWYLHFYSISCLTCSNNKSYSFCSLSNSLFNNSICPSHLSDIHAIECLVHLKDWCNWSCTSSLLLWTKLLGNPPTYAFQGSFAPKIQPIVPNCFLTFMSFTQFLFLFPFLFLFVIRFSSTHQMPQHEIVNNPIKVHCP